MKALLIGILSLLFPFTLLADNTTSSPSPALTPQPNASPFKATELKPSQSKPQPKELRIIRITPEGADVPPGRQVVIEFNRPVVPIGRMQRSSAEIPIVFTPRLNCQWRWLNASALACNLNEKDALTPATKYALTINPGIKATDGATIAQAYHHVFITQRPDVKSAWIDYWESP